MQKDHPADIHLIELGGLLARSGVPFQAKRRQFRTPDQGEIEYIQVFETYPVVNVMFHGMNFIVTGDDQAHQLPVGDLEAIVRKIGEIRASAMKKFGLV